ncbi:TolC family protein [Taibaiella sp. KBW10]|uniref:TolC family protein n=1 Tax=Taibaiella sp. KBW10 TaxID=2153357 RepID=UPI000F5B54EE|nr:TolC family protein [Taibaiella sp. KBW10]RQO30122.1 TolC family protein [Taibaiella sp. KBW10]
MIQKNKLSVFAFAALMAMSLDALAQEKRNMSLEEAIELGVKNNKSLKRSAVALNIANAQVEEAKDRRLPDVKISAQYMRLNTPSISGPLLKSLASEGGEQSSGSFKVNQVALGMATASLPLYSGSRISNGIQAAKYLQKAATLDVDNQQEAVIQNTIESYYNLYKAQSYLNLVKENLKTSNQRAKDFTNMEKNGLIPRNDLLNIQLQEKNMELALLDAENDTKIANYNFDLLLGIDDQTEIGIAKDIHHEVVNLQAVDNFSVQAMQNRKDLAALENRAEAAAYNTKITKGAYLPSLALSGSYIAADVHNLVTVQNAMNVGVGLSYNIADLYKNKAKVKQSVAQQEDIKLAQEEMVDGIKVQIHKAYQDYQESLKKVDVLSSAIDLANENYKIVKNKYDNSLATATELLDADASKLQANVNYEFAKVDSKIAYNKLLLTSGLLNQTYYPQKK